MTTITYNIKLTVKLLNKNTIKKTINNCPKPMLPAQLELLEDYAESRMQIDATGWTISYSPSDISLETY